MDIDKFNSGISAFFCEDPSSEGRPCLHFPNQAQVYGYVHEPHPFSNGKPYLQVSVHLDGDEWDPELLIGDAVRMNVTVMDGDVIYNWDARRKGTRRLHTNRADLRALKRVKELMAERDQQHHALKDEGGDFVNADAESAWDRVTSEFEMDLSREGLVDDLVVMIDALMGR